LDDVAAAFEAVEPPEEDAVPVMMLPPLEPVAVAMVAEPVEFPEPEVVMAVYSVVVNEQDRTRSFASSHT
jgi:hypothetical protein